MKENIRGFIKEKFNRNNKVIIVSSIGRSGSTMLFRSLGRSALYAPSFLSHRRLVNCLLDQAWSLESTSFEDGVIYQTHDYPPSLSFHQNFKYIYIFSDPYKVIPSLLLKTQRDGEDWLHRHAKHLRSSVDCLSDILHSDALHLEDHFDAWREFSSSNIIYVRFNYLWNCIQDISEFVNFKVTLPDRRDRISSLEVLSDYQARIVESVYGSLHEKVMSLDCDYN